MTEFYSVGSLYSTENFKVQDLDRKTNLHIIVVTKTLGLKPDKQDTKMVDDAGDQIPLKAKPSPNKNFSLKAKHLEHQND